MDKEEALQIAKTLRRMADAMDRKNGMYADGKATAYIEAAEMIEEAVEALGDGRFGMGRAGSIQGIPRDAV